MSTAITTNGNGKKSVTVAQLATELGISEDDLKASLMSPNLGADSPVPDKKAEQLRKTYQALKNPVTASLITSDQLSESELKENVAQLASYTKTPQYMVKAIAKVVFEKQALKAYVEGQEQALLKHTLEQIGEQGKTDLENKLALEKIQNLDASLSELVADKNYYSTEETLKRMGLGSIMGNDFSKSYEDLKTEETLKQSAIKKLANGEKLTEEEKKIAWIQHLLSLKSNL